MLSIIYIVIAFFLAITVHEFMHAWTANYLGDSTPYKAGRVSLNPIAHIDPIGTVLLPAILILAGSRVVFGYAKPVPINPNNFANPRLGSALTAVAGPVANFLLATFFALILKFGGITMVLSELFFDIVLINLGLMIFNLVPIPPLDGSKFFAYFFPVLDNPRLEMYGPLILIALLYLRAFSFITDIIIFMITRVYGLSVNLLF